MQFLRSCGGEFEQSEKLQLDGTLFPDAKNVPSLEGLGLSWNLTIEY